MRAPCAGVPLPGGRPPPSGRILMSQAAISAAVIGLPSPGPSATATLAKQANATPAAQPENLCINMSDLAFAVDRPARDAVVMLRRERGHRRDGLGLTTLGDNLGTRRLHVAGLVPCAALQNSRTAIPIPRQPKSGQRFWQ